MSSLFQFSFFSKYLLISKWLLINISFYYRKQQQMTYLYSNRTQVIWSSLPKGEAPPIVCGRPSASFLIAHPCAFRHRPCTHPAPTQASRTTNKLHNNNIFMHMTYYDNRAYDLRIHMRSVTIRRYAAGALPLSYVPWGIHCSMADQTRSI